MGCGTSVDLSATPLPVAKLQGRPLASLSAGYAHTAAVVDSDRSLHLWGWNKSGGLGIAAQTSKVPIEPPLPPMADGVRVVSATCGGHSTYVRLCETRTTEGGPESGSGTVL